MAGYSFSIKYFLFLYTWRMKILGITVCEEIPDIRVRGILLVHNNINNRLL